MYGYTEIYDFVFDNLKHFIFPEEWLAADLEMPKQELLLLFVAERRGEIIMSQVADYIKIPMSTATGIVDRLVKKDYLLRDRSESDRRVVVIKLSAEGKNFIAGIKSHISGYIKKANNVLTDEEREFLFKIASKIIGALQEHSSEIDKQSNTIGKIRKIDIE